MVLFLIAFVARDRAHRSAAATAVSSRKPAGTCPSDEDDAHRLRRPAMSPERKPSRIACSITTTTASRSTTTRCRAGGCGSCSGRRSASRCSTGSERTGHRHRQGPDRELRAPTWPRRARSYGETGVASAAPAGRGRPCSPLPHDPAVLERREGTVRETCSPCHGRRRRQHRSEPDRRLLDPRRRPGQIAEHTIDERRARQGHARLGPDAQAGPGPGARRPT